MSLTTNEYDISGGRSRPRNRAMERFFNTEGPCIPEEHYMLPPTDRVKGIDRLIQRKRYFVLHAPRQSGKTTFLKALAQQINEDGTRVALYVSLERVQGQGAREQAIPTIIQSIGDWGSSRPNFRLDPDLVSELAADDPSSALGRFLKAWCAQLDRPLVLLLDETDCLSGDGLISFLRQLRDGYVGRSETPFPSSVALVGMRNIRDYRANVRPNHESLGSTSPFNIVAQALTLANFTRDEVAALYAQHADETGQPFEMAAVDRVFELTKGQPWLVNALATHCVDELVVDTAEPIAAAHVDKAKEHIIQTRPTHLDSLMARLRETRVQRVIEPMLHGGKLAVHPDHDDYCLTVDLGLIREVPGAATIANPIYAEIIPRYLASITELDAELPNAGAFLTPDGGLAMCSLIRTFQQFWRENSEIWIDRYAYREAGPHLVLQAYLQRIVNANGTITRECAAGSGRVDLCVERGGNRYALELKSVRPGQTLERVQSQGLDQLGAYLDRLGLDEGYLLIFDQREGRSWDDRICEQQTERGGKTIHIFGA